MKDIAFLYELFSAAVILLTGFATGYFFHKKVVVASRERKIEAYKTSLVENGDASSAAAYEGFLRGFIEWLAEERTVGRKH